ncbi:squalene/phytoene synthase family protein [Staphylococcus sp. ACRSN]|uniref:squalene/phytoene synthase family protein n=1 Tax=Staphylococcus sp. ACRSN TaxID=2918214 RepID=UPI001EF2B5BA|nr:squalene/phytoene synthase family protein [Staphylococcus sp. ACRSN]MCG7339163.1 squalene/phytoene synthase family protein [Staphylococcus sp. ACRSN]
MGNLQKDYKYCQKLTKHHAKAFANTFDQVEENKRNALWSIYAFYYSVDACIRVHKDIAYLNNIKIDIQQIYKGETKKFHSNAKIMRPLAKTINSYNLAKFPFETLLQTIEDDFLFSINDTDQQLMDYCYGASGVVGELLNPIFTHEQSNSSLIDETKTMSIEMGKAIQLTKILRNVGKDYSDERVYLCTEQLDFYNVDLDTIYYNGVTPNYAHLWENYAKAIENKFARVLNHLYLYDTDIKPIIVLTIKTYQGLLEEVRRNLYDMTKHAKLSSYKKSKIYRKVMETYNIQ